MSRAMIATGGKAGAGKNYILERLCQYHAGQNGPFAIAEFGDLVRAELQAEGFRDPPRKMQQSHGQMRRQENEKYWIYRALRWVDGLPPHVVVGFTGVRFENELEALKYGGFKVGLIEAPLEVRRLRLYRRDGRWWTDEELNHVTETSLDLIPHSRWDFVWDNS